MRVDISRWPVISKLLDEVLDLPAEEHAAWFARLSAENPDLEPQLRELLRGQSGSETRDFLPSLQPYVDTEDYRPGMCVAGYRLIRELGRGGMGAVWLAAGSGQLSKRPVALKLPIVSAQRKALAERFARERDILAGLTHPNIARLYDAGVAADGQPFLALEYVEGLTLTQFCDERRLGIEARLSLFAQVLLAVQYAHANLVLHRDLKPSNILVTADGDVRLLDFGIAKLMVEGEAKETELTLLGGRALTPDYASPEQILGSPLNTASDVYSLGVLLYELLTGSRPYRLTRASRAALEEAIVRDDPPRPSQAVDEAHSALLSLPARKLRKTLAGDLDTIVLKALKKLPAERYATAEAFLRDLERYRVGEPVAARPDGALYRLNKFITRHRLPAAGAALLAATLIAATWVSLRQAEIARAHAARAELEATRAQAVQGFLLDIFRTNSHLQSDPQKARQTTARELLDIGANGVGTDLRDAPAAQAEVLMTLADMYTQMGLDRRAAELRLQRIDALKRARGANDPQVADALLDYVIDVADTPERVRIPPALQEARRILDAAGDDDSEIRAGLWLEYSHWYRYSAPDKMRRYADAGLAILARGYRDRGSYLWALAYAAQARAALGAYGDAEPLYAEMLAAVRRSKPPGSAWEVSPLAELAEIRAALLQVDAAERGYRESLAISRRLNGETHRETVQSAARLGEFLHHTSRRAEGRELQERALEQLERSPGGSGSSLVAAVRGAYGRSLLDEGRLAAAEPLLAADVASTRSLYPGTSLLARGLLAQARLYTAEGRYEEAERTLAEASSLRRQVGGGAQDPALANPYLIAAARLALARGQVPAALAAAQAVQPPKDAALLPLPVDATEVQLVRSAAALREGRVQDAVDAARTALAAVQGSAVRVYFQSLEADAALALGEALRRAGDPQQARVHLERALELRRQGEASGSPKLAAAKAALAACLADLHCVPSARTSPPAACAARQAAAHSAPDPT